MSPSFVGNDLPNAALRYSILLGQGISAALSGRVFDSDFTNYVVREFYVAAVFSGGHAALCNHVGCVVGGRSKKQVGGAHAFSIVTAMQDAQAVWYRTICKLPRVPVGQHQRAPSPVTVDLEVSISVSETTSRPYPAPTSLADLGPETVYLID
jgi:hypothetical protein